MIMTWANKILNDIDKYEHYSFKDNVSNRLNKVMDLYLKELDSTCSRILSKRRRDLVMKELSKEGN